MRTFSQRVHNTAIRLHYCGVSHGAALIDGKLPVLVAQQHSMYTRCPYVNTGTVALERRHAATFHITQFTRHQSLRINFPHFRSAFYLAHYAIPHSTYSPHVPMADQQSPVATLVSDSRPILLKHSLQATALHHTVNNTNAINCLSGTYLYSAKKQFNSPQQNTKCHNAPVPRDIN